MLTKIFIKTRGFNNVGIKTEIPAGERGNAKAFFLEHETTNKGKGKTREVCLAAVNEQLSLLDVKAQTEPTVFFVPEYFLETIQKDWHKYWLMSGGKKSSGESINDTELAEWKKFAKLYKAKGDIIVFKDIMTANYKGINPPRFNKEEVLFNKRMYDWVTNKMDQLTDKFGDIEVAE